MSDYGYQPVTGVYPVRIKRPAESKTFTLNWAVELDGETITDSSWYTDGLTNATDSYSGTDSDITLSGGRDGYLYEVVNTITTATQTLEKRMTVAVRK